MSRNPLTPASLFLLATLGLLIPLGTSAKEAPKEAAKNSGVAGGLLIDVLDDGINVQVDGEDAPTKYLYGAGISKQTLLKRNIFNVDRVNVKFKIEGDAHALLAIEKVVGRPQGTVVGEVLKVYNNFWVAVKPKNGPIDGYALNFPPEKFKQSHDLIKTLQPGDTVAIKYATDFERHRILEMTVQPAKPSKQFARALSRPCIVTPAFANAGGERMAEAMGLHCEIRRTPAAR